MNSYNPKFKNTASEVVAAHDFHRTKSRALVMQQLYVTQLVLLEI
jgi:hypothetical protein